MRPHFDSIHRVSPLTANRDSDTVSLVTDTVDLIFMRNALNLILPKLAKVIHSLSQFAIKFKDFSNLGFRHY